MTDKKQISTIPLLKILTKYAIKHAVVFRGVESNAIVEAMQEYAEAWHTVKLKEELMQYQNYLRENGYAGLYEDEIDEYIKQRNKQDNG